MLLLIFLLILLKVNADEPDKVDQVMKLAYDFR